MAKKDNNFYIEEVENDLKRFINRVKQRFS